MPLFSKLVDFLFPKNPKVLHLENLSSAKLLELLPSCSTLEEKDTLALFDYSHPLVKEMIWEIKYHGNQTLAERLGEILSDVIESELLEQQALEKFPNIVLIPMPISDKRRLERGWNQAELLAKSVKSLDKTQKFKYLPRQLTKIRHTESQTKTATRSERVQNLKGSMMVQNPLSVEEQYVVLVDDVVTTGSTFAEAKRALRLAGARKVLCVAVAH